RAILQHARQQPDCRAQLEVRADARDDALVLQRVATQQADRRGEERNDDGPDDLVHARPSLSPVSAISRSPVSSWPRASNVARKPVAPNAIPMAVSSNACGTGSTMRVVSAAEVFTFSPSTTTYAVSASERSGGRI